MKKISGKALLASLVLAVSIANANNISKYVGVKGNYGVVTKDESCTDCINPTFNPAGVGLGFGIKNNADGGIFVGVEGYLNYALNEPEEIIGEEYYYPNESEKYIARLNMGFSFEINTLVGLNIGEHLNIYALVGLIRTKPRFEWDYQYSVGSYSETEIDVVDIEAKSNISPQLGIGVGFNASNNLSIKLQYTLSKPKYNVIISSRLIPGYSERYITNFANNNISLSINRAF
ncbi:MAG: outer membrane beta-barrel protein [Rickettsiales bacterium]|jgi:opacity protein-like surface antigen|nr:outer membrane beta-barrel protein [Rickettsiales bacterium]